MAPIYISGLGSISALGSSPEGIWNQYKIPDHFISQRTFGEAMAFAAFLPEGLQEEVQAMRREDSNYRNLDDSVLYAMRAAREAVKAAGWKKTTDIGVNIGSSRGATGLFERYHQEFLRTGKAATPASPSTTLGNISSWVSQDLQTKGPEFSHSVTCSTGLHAVLNAIAWLQAGLAQRFLAGGSEAALTPFTLAQMKAMKIYASQNGAYPCRALDMEKGRNSMILGEGAGVLALEKTIPEHCMGIITGVGYATENLKHSVSISTEGESLQKSMTMACPDRKVDAVVMHAPGTIKGDRSELNAIQAFFGEDLPALTTNKWKLGHTFAASGILNLELALLMLQHQEFIPVPFSGLSSSPKKLDRVLVNAIGFGGNAVSVVVERPQEKVASI